MRRLRMFDGEQDWDEAAHLQRLKDDCKRLRAARRSAALIQWPVCRSMAAEAGLELKRITEDHFRLAVGQFVYDLHISPGRIIKPKNAPRLVVPKVWDLAAVVSSAIRMAAERP